MIKLQSTYIYGLHAVDALLRQSPERVQQLFVQAGRHDARMKAVLELAEKKHVRSSFVARSALDEWTQHAVHQGIVAAVAIVPQYIEADLLPFLDKLTKPPFLLILDGVQDPRNLGACLRTANAAGVDAVIVPSDKSASLTDVVSKVASGAAEETPLIQVTNLSRTLRDLKEWGIWIYGASGAAEATVFEGDFLGAIAWVLGAEGRGLRRLTEENCDALFHIPMQGTVSSLNVSVAAGVCLFESIRQRMR
ncbi:MAG: rlmB [Gammaproteobacteria bacterium]|nr:rlmB [Gammaproteobacteria bacterium]